VRPPSEAKKRNPNNDLSLTLEPFPKNPQTEAQVFSKNPQTEAQAFSKNPQTEAQVLS